MEAVEIKIERTTISSKECIIFGKLYINEQFVCYTLEPLDKLIDLGTYKCKPEVNIKNQRRIRLFQVPKRSGILIHVGNNKSDTQGCILVGCVMYQNMIMQSTRAMNKIWSILYEKNALDSVIKITIK